MKNFILVCIMKTITFSSTDKKMNLLVQVAKEMGITAKPHKKITDEEMALPGAKATKAQLEEWLAEDDGEGGYTSQQMRERLRKRTAKKQVA